MTGAGLILIICIWVGVWIACRALVEREHRRYEAHLAARLQLRREVRAELAQRRNNVRVRGCTCRHCHTLNAGRQYR